MTPRRVQSCVPGPRRWRPATLDDGPGLRVNADSRWRFGQRISNLGSSTLFGEEPYFEATNLLKGIVARGPVVGFDLVGIVPAHDLHDQTSLLGARLILNLVGALAHAGRIGEFERDTATPSRPAGRPTIAGRVREPLLS